MPASLLLQGLSRYLGREELSLLAGVTVGVAGAGGLGSNVALLLARTGVRRFLVVDADTIEPSNLNRQQYFPEDVGAFKVDALARTLHRLDGGIGVATEKLRVDEANAASLVGRADLWVEAFDGPESKRVIVEAALRSGRFVASASGMAGWGGAPMRRRELGLLVAVGDFERDIRDYPPLAPRVTQAAAMLADAVVCRILGPCRPLGERPLPEGRR